MDQKCSSVAELYEGRFDVSHIQGALGDTMRWTVEVRRKEEGTQGKRTEGEGEDTSEERNHKEEERTMTEREEGKTGD